jgi:lipopolysaccharide/colanic/teichoic acid biosynthesis glycosyltransferase
MPLEKRIFDITAACLGMIVTAPLWVVIIVINLLLHGAPIFFHQVRPGYKGKPFTLHKFRTMDDSPTSKDDLLPDSQRITRFGRLLRSLSFDELPEMINILRGEMSFVGPRPLLMEYLTLYSPAQARRHDVVPGLTGWAQVHGRNALDWQSRLAMDVWYVDHWSFWLDMRIILTTLWKVIRRENINQPGQATVEYFKGNKD